MSPPKRPKATACGFFGFFLAIWDLRIAYVPLCDVQIPNLILFESVDMLERSGIYYSYSALALSLIPRLIWSMS